MDKKIMLVQKTKYFGKNYYYPFCQSSEILLLVIGNKTYTDRDLFWLTGLGYEFRQYNTGESLS